MKTDVLDGPLAFAGAALLTCLFAFSGTAVAQSAGQIGWAGPNDALAKHLIDQERKWATLSCTPKSTIVSYGTAFVDEFIADDFVGTSPKAVLYTKADMTTLPKDWEPERDCKLLSAKVRFIKPDVAVIYGSESAVAKGSNGKFSTRTLVWTDTLLMRAGKWQVIAVQDMAVPVK